MANSDLKPTLAECVEVHGIDDQEGTIHVLLGRKVWGGGGKGGERERDNKILMIKGAKCK